MTWRGGFIIILTRHFIEFAAEIRLGDSFWMMAAGVLLAKFGKIAAGSLSRRRIRHHANPNTTRSGRPTETSETPICAKTISAGRTVLQRSASKSTEYEFYHTTISRQLFISLVWLSSCHEANLQECTSKYLSVLDCCRGKWGLNARFHEQHLCVRFMRFPT